MAVILIAFSCIALWFWGRGSIIGGMLMTPPLVYIGVIFGGAREATEHITAVYHLQVCIGIGVTLLAAWLPYMFHERQTQLTG